MKSSPNVLTDIYNTVEKPNKIIKNNFVLKNKLRRSGVLIHFCM